MDAADTREVFDFMPEMEGFAISDMEEEPLWGRAERRAAGIVWGGTPVSHAITPFSASASTSTSCLLYTSPSPRD